MESENKKEIGVADGKDLECKFDVNITEVTSFRDLICLIAMLHIIPNLNKFIHLLFNLTRIIEFKLNILFNIILKLINCLLHRHYYLHHH